MSFGTQLIVEVGNRFDDMRFAVRKAVEQGRTTARTAEMTEAVIDASFAVLVEVVRELQRPPAEPEPQDAASS
jgi:hypothetical protein